MSLYVCRRQFFAFSFTILGVLFIMNNKLYLRNFLANSCLVLAVCIFFRFPSVMKVFFNIWSNLPV